MIKHGQAWLIMINSDQQWPRMIHSDQSWSILNKSDQNHHESLMMINYDISIMIKHDQ
jgi:hypothetical protein